MSSKDVISVKNVSKSYHIYQQPRDRLLQMLCGGYKQFYKEFWAVQDISFTIKPGEALGIIGKNGSGKSTLLQLICGTLFPTKGHIKTNGRIAALLELGSGFNNEFTGRENVFTCATLYGLHQSEIEERFDKIAKFADIGDFIEQPVKKYSSGMYLRLAFAVIAHIDADVLIIDEALSVGDAFFQQKCMRFLRHFREKGTLIFVSHDSGAIINLCDRGLLLNQGRLIMDGLPKDVTDTYLAYIFEEQQGKSDEEFHKKNDEPQQPVTTENVTPAVTEFDPLSASFGSGDGLILNVWLENLDGIKINHVFGNQRVILYVKMLTKNDIEQPIVGFQIKDRLGQVIFGENTYLTYKKSSLFLQSGWHVLTKFSFIMPFMQAGPYSITVAFANGTQENHVQLHWVHDAFVFELCPEDRNRIYFDGLIKIPIEKIELTVLTTTVS